MIFQQYYLACLSHASYLIGDQTTGRAVVVDPQRDVAQYLRDAHADGLTIERVIETHFHADFLSGHLELQALTGAVISYGSAAEAMAQFPIEPLAHGQHLSLGDVVLEIRHTPGHTPESISVVVFEHAEDVTSGRSPYGVLTGDTLFIGDVGRPDLLSSVGVSADALARQLYHSTRNQLLTLPDDTRVFPAHGAGSACGKNLSSATASTIGEQRRTNYALQPMSEDDFVRVVTAGQSDAPLYFAFAADANKQAHAVLAEDAPPPPMTMSEVLAQQRRGAVVLDTRDAAVFAQGHLKGSYNVGLAGRYAEYAGDVLVPDRPIVLVSEPGTELEARTRLARIGFDRVIGSLIDPVAAFLAHPRWIAVGSRLTVAELQQRRGSVDGLQVVDVRGPGETAAGRVPGARELALPRFLDRLVELDPTAPTVVYCAGGYRSMIAASVMRAAGFSDVSDLIGGFGAWEQAGLPTEAANATVSGSPCSGPVAGTVDGGGASAQGTETGR
ncbi:MAG: MBL fold metallo-hydrolase [Acidimicrobiales bacterium]